MKILVAALILSTPAFAGDNLICDYEHKCYSGRPSPPPQIYHMDPTHPDKETPPPAPQYSGIVPKPYVPKPYVPVAPPITAEVPEYNPNPDCENMRHALFPTAEAAFNARAHCLPGAQWYPQ
jgi:hypothetical protein